MENSRSAVRMLGSGAVAGLFAAASVLAVADVPAGASGSVHVRPHHLTFQGRPVPGGGCEGSGCVYGMVTVVNSTDAAVTIDGGSTSNQVFWITWGGTCNTPDAYVLPAHQSCTVQFGFIPSQANTVSTGDGFLQISGGVTLEVGLKGRSA